MKIFLKSIKKKKQNKKSLPNIKVYAHIIEIRIRNKEQKKIWMRRRKNLNLSK